MIITCDSCSRCSGCVFATTGICVHVSLRDLIIWWHSWKLTLFLHYSAAITLLKCWWWGDLAARKWIDMFDLHEYYVKCVCVCVCVSVMTEAGWGKKACLTVYRASLTLPHWLLHTLWVNIRHLLPPLLSSLLPPLLSSLLPPLLSSLPFSPLSFLPCSPLSFLPCSPLSPSLLSPSSPALLPPLTCSVFISAPFPFDYTPLRLSSQLFLCHNDSSVSIFPLFFFSLPHTLLCLINTCVTYLVALNY